MDRYLTHHLPGIGGKIKQQTSDFQVVELPLYPPAGQGAHTYFEIEKIGLSTFEAVRNLAIALRVPSSDVGYAGLKDAQAVTRQVLSVLGVPPEAVTGLEVPGIRVLWAERHPTKLKIGHLRGNRFAIRIRDVPEAALDTCRAILQVLARRGVPNRYGPQRFGMRGDSARLGRAVVLAEAESFVRSFLGEPHGGESEVVQAARTRFEAGEWVEALALLPHTMADERQTLRILIESSGDYLQAYRAVSRRLKVFLVSAYQSELFNRVLDARLDSLDQVFAGDVAVKHPGNSLFPVTDEATEQPRAERFETSPTGPIYGYKMMPTAGRQGELEAAVLAAEGLTLDQFRVGSSAPAKGTRRALRFQLGEPELSYDEGVLLRFWLPPGCYATAVLSELMKVPPAGDQPQDVTDLTEL